MSNPEQGTFPASPDGFERNGMSVGTDPAELVAERGNSGPINCSVIIPTIRQVEVLSQTLESLATQWGRNFEVIVVCDGEDPQTVALSQSYSANYPLRWIFFSENR